MDKLSLKNKDWKDFYLSDFFDFEKGNQNNMASLSTGTLPLVSAKKTDNGYKGFVSKEQKKAKQEEIMNKEKAAAELKQKYFSPEGELYKKRESLMQPIQEEIYNAVKEIADLRGYSLVLDRASDTAIIFGSPKIDISDEVLRKLGYSPR